MKAAERAVWQALRENRVADAERIARELLADTEGSWGHDSPELVGPLDLLAIVLDRTRDRATLAEQLALHERALRITESARGWEDIQTATGLHKVGLALWGLGRHEEALAAFRRALAISDGTVEGDQLYFLTWELLSCTGSLLVEMHRPEEAIPLLAREARRADSLRHEATRMVAHRILGRALLDAGRRVEAARSLEVALAIAESRDAQRMVDQLRSWLLEARRGD
jgi:tetratricopeptide (TPR) repeat protein